jgi:hypothetical protein
VELRLDLPVGHDVILFEEMQGFVRLAELAGAAPTDPVVGVAPESDDEKYPQALRITIHSPTQWSPSVTIDRDLALRVLKLLDTIRSSSDTAAGESVPKLIDTTDELLEALVRP